MRARAMSILMTSNSLLPSGPTRPMAMSFSASAIASSASAFWMVAVRSLMSVRFLSTNA